MSAQDLEQRARELLAQIRHLLASLPVDCLGSDTDASGQPYPIRDEVIHGITKALSHQPAPVVDDARMARALEWVRTAARGNVGEGDALRAALIESARKHLPAIEEAIAAYDARGGK